MPVSFGLATSLEPDLGAGALREARFFLEGIAALEAGRSFETRDPTAAISAPAYLRKLDLHAGSVAVIPNPLRTRLLRTVFGWSDRKRMLAVASASAFDPESPNTAGRLGRLVAHEVGHLLGLRHCATENCLARPVHDAGELDRLSGFCERCRQRLRSRR